MRCNKCESSNIKSRKNYSHGTSSKAKTSYSCRECDSTDVMQEKKKFFRRR